MQTSVMSVYVKKGEKTRGKESKGIEFLGTVWKRQKILDSMEEVENSGQYGRGRKNQKGENRKWESIAKRYQLDPQHV